MAKVNVNIVRLADNIPVELNAKYADVFVGEHGPDIRFKGTIDAAPNSAVYVPFSYAVEQLLALGAITQKVHDGAVAAVERDAVPNTGLSIGLQKRLLTVVREKPAGAKSGKLKITVTGEASPPAAKASAAADATPPANGNGAEHAGTGNGNGAAPNAAREKRSALYRSMTQFVLDQIVPMYEAKNVPVAANDVHSMVATLFIAETRN